MMTNPEKIIRRTENHRTKSLLNINAKIINYIVENQINNNVFGPSRVYLMNAMLI